MSCAKPLRPQSVCFGNTWRARSKAQSSAGRCRWDAKPGSPLYERIRAEIVAQFPSVSDVRASIARKLEGLRGVVLERKRREEEAGKIPGG